MRKPFRAGGVAVGALAVALTAGAFTFAPSSAAVTTVTSAKVPGSIRPGTPLKAVGAGAPAAASAATAATAVTKLQAVNWAGYASSLRTTTFRFVSAHFTVPALDCTGVAAPNVAWAAHWAGLDGFRATSTTVEQTGVVEACNGTTPQYRAFWEMFPNAPGYPSITINPGDTVSMAVFYNRFTRKFTLTFSDTTTGHSFTRTRACPAGATCRRNSAEAISEAPFDAATSTILPLADFTSASFANVAITNTSGRHRGGLRSSFWNTFKFTQVSDGTNTTVGGDTIPQGTVLDSPTSLVLKHSFIDRWQAANA
jgi:hypothetical protein